MEDWAAVAKAINDRVAELGWRQGELAVRSQVARSTLREIQHHTVERRRSARTLEALSRALGWDRNRLAEIAYPDAASSNGYDGRVPPDADTASRIDGLESRLEGISERLDQIQDDMRTVLHLVRRSD